MPYGSIWDPTRPPREGWLWVPGVGWVQLPSTDPFPFDPGISDPAQPHRIRPQQFVETHLIGPELPVLDQLMEGVDMFGMKLWTILLIAAAIAYFMNK